MKKLLALLILLSSAHLWSTESLKTNDIEKFKEAYKFKIEKKSVIILKKDIPPYEYMYLSLNGKTIKGSQNKKEAVMNIFELVERDYKDAGLNDFEKNKLVQEIVKMQLKNLKKSHDKEEYEKDLILRGRINGYFDSEKRAYITLGLKTYSKARIIQPYQEKE